MIIIIWCVKSKAIFVSNSTLTVKCMSIVSQSELLAKKLQLYYYPTIAVRTFILRLEM